MRFYFRKLAIAIAMLCLIAALVFFSIPRSRTAGPSRSLPSSSVYVGDVSSAFNGSAVEESAADKPPFVYDGAGFVPNEVFSTPILACGVKSVDAAELKSLRDLADKIQSLGGAGERTAAKAIGDYIGQHTASPYAVSLLREKAAIEWKHGFFTDAVESLHAAWDRGKLATEVYQKRLAEDGLSELLPKLSSLGRTKEVEALLAEVAQRPVGGLLAEEIYRAKEKMWFFKNRAEENIYCGFSAANGIASQLGQPRIYPDVHNELEKRSFIADGLSLYELRAHNREANGDLRIIKRERSDAPLPVPSIIHWKFGHYSSLTEYQGGKYRIKDFHLKFDSWVDSEAIAQEASGYFLASSGNPTPAGFAEVGDAEARTIFGRHCVHARDSEGDDFEAGGAAGDFSGPGYQPLPGNGVLGVNPSGNSLAPGPPRGSIGGTGVGGDTNAPDPVPRPPTPTAPSPDAALPQPGDGGGLSGLSGQQAAGFDDEDDVERVDDEGSSGRKGFFSGFSNRVGQALAPIRDIAPFIGMAVAGSAVGLGIIAGGPIGLGMAVLGGAYTVSNMGSLWNHAINLVVDQPNAEPMANYNFRLLNPGLQVFDTPINYNPAYGPKVSIRLEYDQRSTTIPTVSQQSNFGSRWTHSFESFLQKIGSGTPASSARICFGNGNYFDYTYDTSSQTYKSKHSERAKLEYAGAFQAIQVSNIGRIDTSPLLYASVALPGVQQNKGAYLKTGSGDFIPILRNGIPVLFDAGHLVSSVYGRLLAAKRGEDGNIYVLFYRGIGSDGFRNFNVFSCDSGGNAYTMPLSGGGISFGNPTEDQIRSWKLEWLKFFGIPEYLLESYSYGNTLETYLENVTEAIYKLNYSDGSKATYAGPHDRLLLSSLADSSGNLLKINYDGSSRISSITDAVGGVTSFSYTPMNGDGVPWDTFKIRSITDPAGRKASFFYSSTGLLKRIIDPVGVYSDFSYINGDFLKELTTPYGTTKFETGDLYGINDEPGRYIEAMDSSGNKERVEANDFPTYQYNLPLLRQQLLRFLVEDSGVEGLTDPLRPPESLVVGGNAVSFFPRVANLQWRNTYYWNKIQTRNHPGDYSKATVYHWKAQENTITGVLAGIKTPLKPRVWFNYPGQTTAEDLGTSARPSKTVRAVESASGDTAWAVTQTAYHPQSGLVTKTVDAIGREITYEYKDNGVDLAAIKVKEGSSYKLIAAFSDYENHKPGKITDSAGQVTAYAYNPRGQLVLVTNAKNEITSFDYYASDEQGKNLKGRLSSVDGPLPGSSDTVTFDYDEAGNIAEITGPDGYRVVLSYDNIGRLLRVDFPDGTFEEMTYTHLHPTMYRDRLGRTTSMVYNSLRQLVSVTDPANRKTEFAWFPSGALSQIVDAMGRVTTWNYDLEGRPQVKCYPDGSKQRFIYQPLSGRLAAEYNEGGREQTFIYNRDGKLAKRTCSGSGIPTLEFRYTYDDVFGRLRTMIDGTGTSTFAYLPISPGTLGAGRLSSVDGPLPNDTITYTYDRLGRLIRSSCNGFTEDVDLDAIGRITRMTNSLGEFNYSYVGSTFRPQRVDYPNNMSANFDYHSIEKNFSLKELHYKLSNNSTVASFNYQFDAVGNLSQWIQRLPSANIARQWDMTYDAVDQLTGVIAKNPDTLVALKNGNFAFGYDKVGNRLSETVDGSTTTCSYNALNQLVSITGGSSSSLPDLGYEWNAEHRLSAIIFPETGRRSEFAYDGFGRRASVTERSNAQTISSSKFVWAGSSLVEQRDAVGTTVQKRYFALGMENLEDGQLVPLFFASDHSGTVRGVLTDKAVAATIDYDPWGRRQETGTDPTGLMFAGLQRHSPSGLGLGPFRFYAPWQGRWISRNPAGELGLGGPNLYSYKANHPN